MKPADSIKEEVGENSSSKYSEDFAEESKRSQSTPNRHRLSNYERSANDYEEEDFIAESLASEAF